MGVDYSVYDTYNEYDALAAAIGAGTFMVMSIISLVLILITCIAMWKIYVKAGRPGWASLIPFYSQFCLFDIAWGSGWLFLLTFVPCVNIVVSIMVYFKLAKAFGKGTGFGFGLIFLNIIFISILGFGNDEYIGPQ